MRGDKTAVVPVPISPFGNIKQADVGSDGLAGLANLYEHVTMHLRVNDGDSDEKGDNKGTDDNQDDEDKMTDLGELGPWKSGAKMESVTVLGDDVGDLALPVEHEEGHVGRGGLGQAQVTGSHLLALVQQGPHALGAPAGQL